MKYMGSKRVMLDNGLGDALTAQATGVSRFVDLFCGSGAVSWFAASKFAKPVLAVDLQKFATTLAASVIERMEAVPFKDIETEWLQPTLCATEAAPEWKEASAANDLATEERHKHAGELCANDESSSSRLVWSNYGGSYFSPVQALTLDAMLMNLPGGRLRTICLAATIMAASRCAASPGHTAQPFKPTGRAGEYLRRAWNRDPLAYARRATKDICARRARRVGSTEVADANAVAEKLTDRDLVFLDPPYSAVQYSRFYHVLETIARQKCGPVEGVGRYPPYTERPQSLYSVKSASRDAITDLLAKLATRGCTVVLTFPREEASTGLSGIWIERHARRLFRVRRRSVSTRFSTLGGNGTNRDARMDAKELILILTPK